jgi:hypothetical protein
VKNEKKKKKARRARGDAAAFSTKERAACCGFGQAYVSDDSQDTLVKALAHGPTVLEKSVFVCVPP